MAADGPDIVKAYPRLVGTFVVLQVIGWILGALEAAAVLGPVAFAFNTQAGVVWVKTRFTRSVLI